MHPPFLVKLAPILRIYQFSSTCPPGRTDWLTMNFSRQIPHSFIRAAIILGVGLRLLGMTNTPCPKTDHVTLQLKWVTQAQFAGYYAARALGYYGDECLEVTLVPGGLGIHPESVVARGAAQFGITWQASMLESREQGLKVKSIAQIFQRSGMRLISWRETQIHTPAELKGHTVGVWFGGHQYDLLNTLTKHGLRDGRDLQLAPQTMDMRQLLDRRVDAAAAMTYNELAEVLETVNPASGKLYRPEDLNVIDFNAERTAMLEDRIIAGDAWLASAENQAIAVRFLRASVRGWIYCREHPQAAVRAVLAAAPELRSGHQTWQMNEVNRLIWPSPHRIGVMDTVRWRETAKTLQRYGGTKKIADHKAYTDVLIEKALAGLPGTDLTGGKWQPHWA